MKRIGFIGLGAMGLPMATNLLAKGFDVAAYDLQQERLAAISKAGGTATTSPAAASKGADALILMVVNAAQATSVLFDDGALQSLGENGVVILMATCPPGAVGELADAVRAKGRRFIDAPVSGGTAGAIAATLTIMAAAPRSDFDDAKPLFDALGDKIFHVGERAGQGATVKAANQLLCGVHIAVAAEAFSLATKLGIDTEVLLQLVGNSSASSWMIRDRGPRMLMSDPEVTSAIDIFVKDLGIVLEAGRDAKAALPLAGVAHQFFLASSGRGEGSMDDSQVIRSYHQLNGIEEE